MTRKKSSEEKLSTNLLVPFTGAAAEEIRLYAEANGLQKTQLIRLLLARGLETVKAGAPLTLTLPGGAV